MKKLASVSVLLLPFRRPIRFHALRLCLARGGGQALPFLGGWSNQRSGWQQRNPSEDGHAFLMGS